MSELTSEVLDIGAIGHQEAMDYFAEFGFSGYRVGKIVSTTGSLVVAQEIDFSRSEDDQDSLTTWSREIFPDTGVQPGARYSIAHEQRDEGLFRYRSTAVKIYDATERESDSLHATLFAVPDSIHPAEPKAQVHDFTHGRAITRHGVRLIEKILPKEGQHYSVTITKAGKGHSGSDS